MARRNQIEQALRRELDERRIPYWVDDTRPHGLIYFEVLGRKFQVFFPKTPSCSRALANCVATLRRIVRNAETAASERSTARQDLLHHP